MSRNPLKSVVRHVRRLSAGSESSPDRQLLSRFADRRDEAAFEEIVRRHGPLVWALCRTALQTADAEDAFQATFLVLARRAANVRKPASLACWLSGVARRVIEESRRRSARRPVIGVSADVGDTYGAGGERSRAEWREVLDVELQRLPDKYRLPIVLCYYQGLTNEEAAARLGWPHGTVCGRLGRAREMLRRRLAGRGITLAAGALTFGGASPPSELLAVTFGIGAGKAGVKWTTGTAAAPVLQLAEGVMHLLWVEKVKLWAIGAAVLVSLGGATGWVMVSANAHTGQPPSAEVGERNDQPADRPAAPPLTPEAIAAEFRRLQTDLLKPATMAEASPTDDELRKLRKECYRLARKEAVARLEAFQAGTVMGTIDVLLNCITNRLLPAELALSDRPADHLAAYERALSLLSLVDAINERRFQNGRISVQDRDYSRYERLRLEIKVLEVKRAVPRPGR